MTRFGYDDGDWDYGRWSLWEQAVTRAISGRRGQAALADLERALLALPKPELIEGHLAQGEAVCAIGALALLKRTEAGEDRDAVLWDLSRKIDPDGWDGDAADVTASVGARCGNMAYAMAWRISELNDEDCRGYTPEERFNAVLRFVRTAQGKEAVTA